MEGFVKGDIVVVPFPFSDLSQTKRRPAVVLCSLAGHDVVLCQVTSKSVQDEYAILLEDADFEFGSLKQTSNVRPNRIFTADSHIILYKIGRLKPQVIARIVSKVISIIQS